MEKFIVSVLSNFGFATLFGVGVLAYLYKNSPTFIGKLNEFTLSINNLSNSVNASVIATDKNTEITGKQYSKVGIILKDIEEFKSLINEFKGELKKQENLINGIYQRQEKIEKTIDSKGDAIVETQIKIMGLLDKMEIRLSNLERKE